MLKFLPKPIGKFMITAFYRQDNSILCKKLAEKESIPDSAVWIDAQSANSHDLDLIQKHCNINLPSKNDVWKNNILNRLYVENGVAYMTAAIITKHESSYPNISAVTFILTPDSLITIRDISPTSFNIFAQRIQTFPDMFRTSAQALEGLLEEMITRVAHNMELVEETLDAFSHRVFAGGKLDEKEKNTSQAMKNVLKELGTCADLNSKTNESLHSINRLMHFFKQIHKDDNELKKDIDIMISDSNVLTQQTQFAAEKIAFLLDALLGMINVEQNLIIKILSVASIFFMPPTLLASLYGMNFKHMPELDWANGYPMAISLMLIFSALPYIYFRKKGWL